MQDSRWSVTKAEYRDRNTSLDLLAMLLLIRHIVVDTNIRKSEVEDVRSAE